MDAKLILPILLAVALAGLIGLGLTSGPRLGEAEPLRARDFPIVWSVDKHSETPARRTVDGPGAVTFPFRLDQRNLTDVRFDFDASADTPRLSARSPDVHIQGPGPYSINSSFVIPGTAPMRGQGFHHFIVWPEPYPATVRARTLDEATARLDTAHAREAGSGNWTVTIRFPTATGDPPVGPQYSVGVSVSAQFIVAYIAQPSAA